MRRSAREQLLYVLSILAALAPIAFALIRAVSAHDLRLLWMAIAAFVGATAVMLVGKVRSRTLRVVIPLAAAALVVATLLSGVTAMMLGATAAPGIWLMSFVLGLCWTAACAFNMLSHPRAV